MLKSFVIDGSDDKFCLLLGRVWLDVLLPMWRANLNSNPIYPVCSTVNVLQTYNIGEMKLKFPEEGHY